MKDVVMTNLLTHMTLSKKFVYVISRAMSIMQTELSPEHVISALDKYISYLNLYLFVNVGTQTVP